MTKTNDAAEQRRRDCAYACTLIAGMMQSLREMEERRWKLHPTTNPGAVHVLIDDAGQANVNVQCSQGGRVVETVTGEGKELYAAFRDCAAKLNDHATIPPSIQRHEMPQAR